jgi:hypothetical protein
VPPSDTLAGYVPTAGKLGVATLGLLGRLHVLPGARSSAHECLAP